MAEYNLQKHILEELNTLKLSVHNGNITNTEIFANIEFIEKLILELTNKKIWINKKDVECLIEGEEITINDYYDIELKG